ncbi:Zn-ribbon domain-containing OB-fold protein [uncultured Jannaschia sp.]|uniref:Zn-ribbon domain-containing OB-fold protein n=1 Tax=uncultured Jannaschia sp. TaxID=293347 RepID=UPI00260F692E|nr:Zn-ribbon domain-containing OB-fold protein [uncultured Jannaschia sp.]
MTDETPPDRVFRDGLTEGRIRLQRCGGCEAFVFYPRVLCPHCHSTDLSWQDASGDGVIHTTTTVRQKPERGGDYNVCMVELAEGVRMMSRVEDVDPSEVRIGMAVRAVVGEIDGASAVVLHAKEA